MLQKYIGYKEKRKSEKSLVRVVWMRLEYTDENGAEGAEMV